MVFVDFFHRFDMRFEDGCRECLWVDGFNVRVMS